MQATQLSEPQPAADNQVEPLLLTVKNTAKTLGVSVSTVWRLIDANHLHTRKIGARTLITMESIRGVAEQGA